MSPREFVLAAFAAVAGVGLIGVLVGAFFVLRARRGKLEAEKGENAALAPRLIMHWSPDDSGMPACGIPLRGNTKWTRELEHATCPTCRADGRRMVLQYEANTR